MVAINPKIFGEGRHGTTSHRVGAGDDAPARDFDFALALAGFDGDVAIIPNDSPRAHGLDAEFAFGHGEGQRFGIRAVEGGDITLGLGAGKEPSGLASAGERGVANREATRAVLTGEGRFELGPAEGAFVRPAFLEVPFQ